MNAVINLPGSQGVSPSAWSRGFITRYHEVQTTPQSNFPVCPMSRTPGERHVHVHAHTHLISVAWPRLHHTAASLCLRCQSRSRSSLLSLSSTLYLKTIIQFPHILRTWLCATYSLKLAVIVDVFSVLFSNFPLIEGRAQFWCSDSFWWPFLICAASWVSWMKWMNGGYSGHVLQQI